MVCRKKGKYLLYCHDLNTPSQFGEEDIAKIFFNHYDFYLVSAHLAIFDDFGAKSLEKIERSYEDNGKVETRKPITSRSSKQCW